MKPPSTGMLATNKWFIGVPHGSISTFQETRTVTAWRIAAAR